MVMRKKKTCYYLQVKTIVYVENPKESTHKLLELIYRLGKVIGYKGTMKNLF